VKLICQPAKVGIFYNSMIGNGNRLETDLVVILKTYNTEECKDKLYVNVGVILIC
jgi:hypothetical protein